MSFYRGMQCRNVVLQGDDGSPVTAYVAKPEGDGPFPSVVLIHHLPGWGEFYIETTRRFAHHGFLAICPNLYSRAGEGDPDDVAARVRAEGGVADAQVVGDTAAAVAWLRAQPESNGKVALFGSCSGGRHAFLYACQRDDVDACAELWGGRVIMQPEEINPKTPVAPITLTASLCCPLIGIFGNDDRKPSPEQVNQHEAELRRHNKSYEFHRYDGAGHGFFYWNRPIYRPEQTMDAWDKVFRFFRQNLDR
ncbi:dienelactone hydrolase family protein [Roseomonas elaeocarpi]|uniref:Dienelactone hydrolase family protein n=1 Tax=Roseomonas elaeocarpi TaxID=907779 RepID=A0ABV6JSW1_9PROT